MLANRTQQLQLAAWTEAAVGTRCPLRIDLHLLRSLSCPTVQSRAARTGKPPAKWPRAQLTRAQSSCQREGGASIGGAGSPHTVTEAEGRGVTRGGGGDTDNQLVIRKGHFGGHLETKIWGVKGVPQNGCGETI